MDQSYTKWQIFWGSFLGGPFAPVYYLSKNYTVMGDFERAKKAKIVGGFLCLIVFAILPFLPENFPNSVIPVMYCVLAQSIRTQYQKELDEYPKKSNWNVLGVAVISLIAFAVIGVGLFITTDSLGLTHIMDAPAETYPTTTFH